jgi:hypothetical protein
MVVSARKNMKKGDGTPLYIKTLIILTPILNIGSLYLLRKGKADVEITMEIDRCKLALRASPSV